MGQGTTEGFPGILPASHPGKLHVQLPPDSEQENQFSVNFARFVNERNVISIMDELSQAQRDIEQNTNSQMVFFDFALRMIVLLIQ